MQTLGVTLAERSYPIHIGNGLLDRPELVLACLAQKRVAIVTNVTVAPLFLERFAERLAAAGVDVVRIVLPDGEEHKNWQSLNSIFDVLLERHCERDITLIALGGGVIGDLTGFAAASYLRGVPYIQVPTTLLAQVDSSVGGKTAINHPLGKNMIGAFYQPRMVLADMDTLKTLPDRQLRAGLAEVIKHGLIRDSQFFNWIEKNIDRLLARDDNALAHSVLRSVEIKSEIVARDEHETGERALLNFGHTFGHAIEAGFGYGAWLHGEAVAAGMVMAADMSCRLGKISQDDVERIRTLLKRAGLPLEPKGLTPQGMIESMSVDKKSRDGRIRFVLLDRIGSACLQSDVSPQVLNQTLSRFLD